MYICIQLTLNNDWIGGTDPCAFKNYIAFDSLCQILITMGLLLTGNFTNTINNRLKHILYVTRVTYCTHNKARWRTENVNRITWKIRLLHCTRNNLHVHGPVQLKPALSEGLLYVEAR